MKILFCTPTLNRTGSEVVLYNLLTHYDKRLFEAAVATDQKGVLVEPLSKQMPVFTAQEFYAEQPSFLTRLKNKASRIVSNTRYLEFWEDVHDRFKPDYWYINTVALPHLIDVAVKVNVPFIVHSHDIDLFIPSYSAAQIKKMIELPAFMIACSQTAEKLLKTLGRTENIEVCYPAVSFSNIKKNGSRAKDIRTSLHIPDDAFVWMMSGYFDYNKNPIRFIEIASELRKFRENVHFVWLGGKLDSGMGVYAKAKAAEMGMTKSISWVGPLAEEYYDYFDAADGFVLTSEKESFSIASVEAVYLQKPVVAFNCGGISEVIDRDSGVIVHSWNVTDIVKAMVDVMEKRISFDLQKASKQIQFLDAPAQVKQWETILAKHLKVTHPAQA